MTIEAGHDLTQIVTHDGAAMELRFNSRRPLNAVTIDLVSDLLDTVRSLTAKPELRVIVFRGLDDVFTGGADLRAVASFNTDQYRHYIETEFALFAAVEALPFITVAALTGACIGNGAELALACDFRLATERVVFALPEAKLGVQGPTQRLPKFVGLGVAKDLLYRARVLRAEEALKLGLVTEVIASSDQDAAITRFVDELVTLPPVATRITKQNIESAYVAASSGLATEIDSSMRTRGTNDFREGVAAFFEKRSARFSGS